MPKNYHSTHQYKRTCHIDTMAPVGPIRLRLACVLGLIVGTLASLQAVNSPGTEILNLGGDVWTVQNSNHSIQVPATVPGMVQTDLFHANMINDSYYLNNYAVRPPTGKTKNNVSEQC